MKSSDSTPISHNLTPTDQLPVGRHARGELAGVEVSRLERHRRLAEGRRQRLVVVLELGDLTAGGVLGAPGLGLDRRRFRAIWVRDAAVR